MISPQKINKIKSIVGTGEKSVYEINNAMGGDPQANSAVLYTMRALEKTGVVESREIPFRRRFKRLWRVK